MISCETGKNALPDAEGVSECIRTYYATHGCLCYNHFEY